MMASWLVCALAAATPETPSDAGAAGRVHLALRTGYGLPLGKYAEVRTLATFRDEDVNALGDDTYGVIPIWLDVGYRLHPRLLLGAYFMYGVVLPKTASASDPLGGGCPEGFDCTAAGVRFGLQGQYSFAPGATINPWVGLALGYEWIQSELSGEVFGAALDAATTHSGPDLLQLQAGADFRIGSGLSLGPFAAASAMQYTSCSLTLAGDESSCELNDGGWHGWLVLGARGALEL
jgi:hypothetical protein